MPARPECVYLIASQASTLVKIGRSIDVQARLAALQAGSPVPLTLLWQTLGGVELETALHQHFKARRAHGEWFQFPERDAIEQVMHALAKIADEAQRQGRVQADQRSRKAQVVKARKIRKVWTAPYRHHKKEILRLAAKPGGVTNMVVVDALNVGRVTAYRTLKALAGRGVIEQRGQGRAAAWHLTADQVQEVDVRQKIRRMAAADGVANRDVTSTLQVSPATAHRYLSALGDEGVIEMRGKGRGARWHMVRMRDDDDAE